MTISVPRLYGELREQYEPASDNSLREGYRVDVRVATDWTALPSVAASARDTLVYRGTIEGWETDSSGTRVTVTALHRLLEETPVPDPTSADEYTDINYPPNLAKTVIDTFIGTSLASAGLIWDSTNAIGVSASTARGSLDDVDSLTYNLTRGDVAKAMDDFRNLQGKGWLYYVTPESTVRFFRADTTTINHYLSDQREIVGYTLPKSNKGRAKKVTVFYENGGRVTATSGTYTAADKRWVTHEASDQDSTTATQLATELLVDLDRLRLTGSITVSGEAYPIESIRLGDVVQCHITRALPTDASHAGYNDYNATPLIVYGLDYDFDAAIVTLHLEAPLPSLVQKLYQAAKDTARGTARAELMRGDITALGSDVAAVESDITTLDTTVTAVDARVGDLEAPSTATSATAGLNGTVPNNVVGFAELPWGSGGATVRVPFFNT
jgi:hypothetical protein